VSCVSVSQFQALNRVIVCLSTTIGKECGTADAIVATGQQGIGWKYCTNITIIFNNTTAIIIMTFIKIIIIIIIMTIIKIIIIMTIIIIIIIY
jgi:hypothetical protein